MGRGVVSDKDDDVGGIALRKADIPDLRVNLLGKTCVVHLGEALELTDRQRQILALLILGKRREEVAEVMWHEVDTKKQRNNLNVQLNTLRKLIEPWGLTTYLHEDGLRRTVSDYLELNAAIEAKDVKTVFGLYQEPFAGGMDLVPIGEERDRLREKVVGLLFEASEGAHGADAAALLERVLDLEPLHEEALQSLLKQLVKRGRRREARRRYEAFATALKNDLGLAPTPDTSDLLKV